mmetsp:Transcript_16535/g.39812  ORF Transcript_16535/g.39812 Transcript_16535/m.39812 type:complete len:477 (-) Transcript_16535:1846-3276(-)
MALPADAQLSRELLIALSVVLYTASTEALQSDPLPPDASLYVRPPSDGSAELPPGHVWHLHKPLYGLAQAPRMWSSTFRKFLIGYGFSKVNCSDSFLTWSRGSSRMQLIVHVNDIVVSYNDPMAFNAFRSALLARFQGTDEGEPSTYLGLDLSITSTKTHLTQSTLARELLDRHGMSSCKPVSLPMEPGRHLLDSDRPDTPDPAMSQTYQEIVGSLQYLCTWTRPDLLFATNQLAKHMSNPGRVHMAAAHRVLRYLKGTADYGLTYSSNSSVPALLRAWADADWATCTDTRRSYSGAVFSLASAAVHWSSKQQTSVSTSTTEAEYVSASKAADDVLWLRRVLEDAGARQDLPTPLFEDNRACRLLSENPIQSRSRHIDYRVMSLRERVSDGIVTVQDCTTHDMVADNMTKNLPFPAFARHRATQLGMFSSFRPSSRVRFSYSVFRPTCPLVSLPQLSNAGGCRADHLSAPQSPRRP